MAFDYVARACTVPYTRRSETSCTPSAWISLESMGNISPYVTDFVKYASNSAAAAYVGVHTLTASFSGALFSGDSRIVANANFRDATARRTRTVPW